MHSCPWGEPPAHPRSAYLSCSCPLVLERSWLALGRPDAQMHMGKDAQPQRTTRVRAWFLLLPLSTSC